LWLICSGFMNFHPQWAFSYSKTAFDLTPLFFVGLGQASVKTVYSYLGYYNVCHLGGEIKKPEINIPRSIFISVAGIAVLYLGMQIMVLGVLPWKEVAASPFVISTYFQRLYNPFVGQIATLLVLIIAGSSLFAVMLGYSRIPYAAATDGNFFKIFAKVHPTKNFPYVSLLFMGGLGFIFSLLFKLTDVITAILTMRIMVQFVGQSVGVLYWHWLKPNEDRPYRMKLFPLPAVIGIIIWLFILFTSPWPFLVGAAGIIATGILIYFLVIERQKSKQQLANNVIN